METKFVNIHRKDIHQYVSMMLFIFSSLENDIYHFS